MATHLILEDVEMTTAPAGSVAGLLCYGCGESMLLPKVDRKHVEESAQLGRTVESAEAFSKAMMAAYKNDPDQKRAITLFLLSHSGHHFITPALILETTATRGSA